MVIAPKKVLVGVIITSPALKHPGHPAKLASHKRFNVIMCELYYTGGVPTSVQLFRQ